MQKLKKHKKIYMFLIFKIGIYISLFKYKKIYTFLHFQIGIYVVLFILLPFIFPSVIMQRHTFRISEISWGVLFLSVVVVSFPVIFYRINTYDFHKLRYWFLGALINFILINIYHYPRIYGLGVPVSGGLFSSGAFAELYRVPSIVLFILSTQIALCLISKKLKRYAVNKLAD